MLKNRSLAFIAFLQATGLVVYIMLVSAFMNFVAPSLFVDELAVPLVAPVIMLLLFILSAVISALLVLGSSGMLFWEKQYKKSLTLLSWTVGWGLLYFTLFVLLVAR